MNFSDQIEYAYHVRRATREGFKPLTGPQFAALVRKIKAAG
jgi:hypothetical protein